MRLLPKTQAIEHCLQDSQHQFGPAFQVGQKLISGYDVCSAILDSFGEILLPAPS